MNFSFFSKQFICSLLIILFVIPVAFLLQPKRVEANLPVIDSANLGTNTITTATELATKPSIISTAISQAGTFISTKLQEVKAYILDGLAFAVINTIIEMLTRDILNWINSGFKGNPAFIQNPEQFFLDVGDQVTGQFLQGSDLALLCTPFSAQVITALATYRGKTGRYQCTLSKVITNSQNFVNNLSSSDTWNNWLQLTSNPANNPYGSFMMANDEISLRIAGETFTQSKLLDWGKGFFSVPDPDCAATNAAARKSSGTYGHIASASDCPKVTPGAAIENQLNANLDSGRQRLVIATSFNQIVSALLSQLAKQALTGAGGLLGLSQSRSNSGSSSNSSYLSKLNGQSISADSAKSLGTSALSDVVDTLAAEQGINGILSGNLSQLKGAQQNLRALLSCYQHTASSSTNANQNQSSFSDTTSTLQSISDRVLLVQSQKDSSDKLIADLSPIRETLQNTQSASSEYQNALFAYKNLRLDPSFTFHSIADLQVAKSANETIPTGQFDGKVAYGKLNIQDEMTALNSATAQKLNLCISPNQETGQGSNSGGGFDGRQ
jgi:hypothetical protein